MDEPVRVGLAGLGRAGWSIHAMTLEKHPAFTVAAVMDTEPERRQEAVARFGCAAYEDYAALAADPHVELVVIATPSFLHAPMAIEALDAGKHVLVDKPMALSVAEADAMLSAARRRARLLSVFHIRRLDPDFLKIREVLDSGVLGPLHAIKMASSSFDRRRDWQTLAKFGGGQLNNTGSHFVDLALALAGGEWDLAFSELRQVACAGDAEDHVRILFRGKAGVTVDIELAISAYHGPRWHLMGKYGSLVGDSERLEWKYYDPAALEAPTVSEGPAAGRKYGSGETLPWVTQSFAMTYPNTFPEFYSRLHASLREGAPLLVPPEEIRNLVALFDACRARRAAAAG